MKKKGMGCWAGVMLAFSFLISSKAEDLQYIYQGTGQWKSFLYDKIQDDHTIHFTAYASYAGDNPWRVEIEYENEYVERFVSGTDGDNIVTVALYKPQYRKTENGYAFIEKAAIPRGDSCLPLSAIWLAFQAPSYLDRLKGSMISPPYFKDGHADKMGYNLLVAFKASRMEMPPGFLHSMEFLHDGKAINPGREWVDAPKPFNTGFTNAIFRVTRFAEGEVLGRNYPAEFRLDYYYPLAEPGNPKSYRLYLMESFQGAVTNLIQTNGIGSLFPELPPRINYLDRRFMNEETPELRLSYASDRYLSDEEGMKLPEFSQAQNRQEALRQPVPLNGPAFPALWVLVILGIVFLLPIWFLVADKQKQRKETQ